MGYNMQTIDDRIVNNLLASLIISLISSLEKQIPEHSRKARALRKVEESIKELGSLHTMEISPEIAMVGARLWNQLLLGLQEFLENYVEDDEQLSLFQDY